MMPRIKPRSFPDLNRLEELEDKEVRFYALVGAIVSLSAALEQTFIEIFQNATGLNRKLSATLLYKNRNSSVQRDLAIEAMRQHLDKDYRLQEWRDISAMVVAATGDKGARNLVGHVCVGLTVILSVGSGKTTEEYYVMQDSDRVLAGDK